MIKDPPVLTIRRNFPRPTAAEIAAFANAVAEVLQAPPRRDAVRSHAHQFGWLPVSRGQAELFARALRQHASSRVNR